MLSDGASVWESPDVLSWSAWIDRELSRARAEHAELPRRLSATAEWLLWREAVSQAASGLNLLAPELLIDSVRRAYQLLEDYGLVLRAATSAETALLIDARDHYRRRCAELGVLDTSSWRACSPWLRPSRRACCWRVLPSMLAASVLLFRVGSWGTER